MVAGFGGGTGSLGAASGQIVLDASRALSSLGQVETGLNNLGNSSTGIGSKLASFERGLTAIGTAAIPAMTVAWRSAIDLEQAIANVNAALGGVDSSTLNDLQSLFQDIGAASQYSAVEVAGVGEALIKAGFDVEQVMNGATQAVVDLAQATGDGLGPAMDGVIQAMSTWSVETVGATDALTDASRVADILTVAANESKAGIGDINAGMRSLGPVAAMMGIPFEDAAAAIALFTNNGLRGADAGVSLARGLQNLADPTSEAAQLMSDLGITAFDAQGNFEGFPALFDQLKTGMAGLTKEQQLQALSTIFGAEAMDVMGLAILNGADPLEAMIALMQESGQASEQAAIRMDTVGAQMGELKESVTNLLASLVQGLLPALRFIVDGLNQFVDALSRVPAPIKTVVGAVLSLSAAYAAFKIALTTARFAAAMLGLETAGLGAAFAGLLPWIAAAIAIGGALYLAWTKDFLGITTAVNTFRDAFASIGSTTNNPLTRFLSSLGAGLKQIKLGPIQKLGEIILDISDAVEDFVDGFTDAWDRFTGPIKDATDAVEEISDPIERVIANGNDLVDFMERGSGAASNLSGNITGLTNAVGQVTGPVTRLAAFLMALAEGLRAVNGDNTPAFLETLANGLDTAAQAVDALVIAFRAFRDQGLNPVVAALRAVGEVFAPLNEMMVEAAGVVENLIAAFRSFRDGDWAGGFDDLREAAERAWNVIGEAAEIMAAAGLALASWVLDVGVPAVTGWIVEAAADAWSAIRRAANWAGPILADLGAWTIETAVPAVTGWLTTAGAWLVRTVGDAFRAVDWAGVFATVVGAWGAAISAALGVGIDITAAIYTWVANAIAAVDWESVGQAVGTGLGTAVRVGIGLLVGLAYIGAELMKQFVSAVAGADWGQVATAIGQYLKAAIPAAFNFLKGLGQGFIDGLFGPGTMASLQSKVDAIIDAFNGLPSALQRISDLAFKTLNDAAAPVAATLRTLYDIAVLLVGLAWDTISGGFSGISTAISAIGEVIGPVITGLEKLIDLYNKVASLTGRSGDTTTDVTDTSADPVGPVPGEPRGNGAGAAPVLDQVGPKLTAIAEAGYAAAAALVAFGSSLGTATQQIIGPTLPAFDNFLGKTQATGAGVTAFGGIVALAFAGIPVAVGASLATAAGITATNTGAMQATSTANFGAMAGNAAARLATMLGSVASNFSQMNSTATSNATSMGAAVGSAVSSMASNVGSRFSSMASGAATTMAGMRIGAVAAAQTTGSGIANGIGNGAASALSRLGGAMSQMAGVISSYGGGAASTAYGIGQNIGLSLAAGLGSAAGAVAAQAAALVAQADIAMRAKARIASPSKLFRLRGQQTGEGYALGLEDMLTEVGKQGAAMVAAAAGSLPGYGIPAYAGTVPYVAGVGGGSSVVNHYYTMAPGAVQVTEASNARETASLVISEIHGAFREVR